MSQQTSGDFNNNSKPPESYFTVPTVVTKTETGHPVAQDIFSRLLADNVIPVVGPIGTVNSEIIASAMLQVFYDKIKPKIDKANGDLRKVPEKDRKIKMLINSPGGSVRDGMQIYDTMQLLKSEGVIIETHAKGIAMSMGSVLLCSGSEGYRKAWPSASIMLHQLSGGAIGKHQDMKTTMEETNFIGETLKAVYKNHTDLSEDEIEKIFTNTDYHMRGEEAVELGVIDKVIYPAHNKKLASSMKEMNLQHWKTVSKRLRPYQDANASNDNSKKGPDQSGPKQAPGAS